MSARDAGAPEPPTAAAAPEIREAVAEDAPAIAALISELGYPVTTEVLAARLRAYHAAGEVALVATRGGEVLGLLTVHLTPVLHRPTPVGRLTMLVVTEAARGMGVGRALVAAAERHLAARGCALVEVTSNRRRTDAHAFYERLGYEVTSLRFWKVLGG
ncbi:MAG TPA: GNAT family N-acetyltransferase [Gemmatimonadaceae bacterium]|nr:GNAT family N-acetyltransferase [Gemmatimonadaceae bacterium]